MIRIHSLFLYLCIITSSDVMLVNIMAQDVTTAANSPTEFSETPTIQRLTAETGRLKTLVDLWNDKYVGWLIASILLGGISIVVVTGTVYSQFKTIRLAKALSDTQSQLDSEKDRELRSGFSKRDERIAELTAATEVSASELVKSGARIKEAEAEIARAHAESRDAVARVSTAEAKVAAAQLGAAEASAKAESFRLDIAKANERAADANRIAESERLARVRLEIRLADRTFTQQQSSEISNSLRQFTGISVGVIVWSDAAEVQHISGLILASLRNAGWTVQNANTIGGGAALKGILVGVRSDAPQATQDAARRLIFELQRHGLDAASWNFNELTPPSATMNFGFTGTEPVRVFIGNKP
jgi:hypothetical protein